MNELKSLLSITLQKRQSLNPGYSQNAFARDLGVSPTALSQFLSNKRTLSRTNVRRIVDSLELPNEYNEKFLNVDRNVSTSTRLKLDTFSMISDWYHYAILNLVEIDATHSSKHIAGRLGIPQELVDQAIERLISLGLMKKTDKGFERTYAALDSGTDVPSEALRKHNREKMELAIQSLERVSIENRDVSSLTLCFDPKRMSLLKSEIAKFKKRIGTMCAVNDATEVYSLNVQFFPLTQGMNQ
jgi:Predicted transcriptional regulator